MTKKKKKIIAKRRSRAKLKKRRKTKSRSNDLKPNVEFINKPTISEIEPPIGFQTLSMSQAMLEYAKPIMEFVEKGVVSDLNNTFQLAIPLWNYTLSQDFKYNKKDIIKKIGEVLRLNAEDATEFFEMMIERKKSLFPDEIQPDNPMVMFMRQERHYLISEFSYNSLNISNEAYLPDNEDEKLVQSINQMDRYVTEGVKSDEWEDHYFSMEDRCKERFKKWLVFKEVKEFSEDFPFYVEIYLNFIYRYMHPDNINLKRVLPIYIEEFFADYVLRKVIIEPHEYIKWPPALKLFYNFLYEIGYLKNPEMTIKLLDEIEPYFIKILRRKYS